MTTSQPAQRTNGGRARSGCGLIVLVVLLALPAGARAEHSPDTSPSGLSSRVEARTLHVSEVRKDVRHLVFTPSAYAADVEHRRWPLIVGLHGTAGHPEQVMDFPRFQDLAERFGFLVVCPYSSGVGDLAQRYVAAVVDDTQRHFRVDPERIFLLGFSRGGAGVWGLGARYSDRWAGLVPISPATSSDPALLERMRDLPVLVVIGDQDKAVSLRSVRRWVRRMGQLGMAYQFVELPGMGHDLSRVQFLPLVFAFLDHHARADALVDLGTFRGVR